MSSGEQTRRVLGVMLAAVAVAVVRMYGEIPRTGLLRPEGQPRRAGLARGREAPGFRLQSTCGDTVDLGTYAGRSVALIFVSPGCPHCSRLKDELLTRDYGPYADRVLLVSRESGGGEQRPPEVAAREDSVAARYVVLLESSYALREAYSVRGVPTTYLVDGQGLVMESMVGERSLELVDWLIRDMAEREGHREDGL